MKKKDLYKLLLALVALGALFIAIFFIAKLEDPQSKYKHPITQPGAKW